MIGPISARFPSHKMNLTHTFNLAHEVGFEIGIDYSEKDTK